ncbi:cell wall-binding protein [Streptococcus pneumoniae]|nr:cell wall-binding protein [Streptococcus pneumoniae]
MVLGASLAIATLSLVSLVEIEGLSPFLIENVSANTHSANKVINHKVSIYLENADEGKGLTVNFSTDSVSPNLFDEFEKKSGITITTMLVNAKTGEVVEKRLTPSVFLRSNDLTSGTISSFIFSEYPDGEYKYVVSEGDFIDPKTQFKHQYRGESPIFSIKDGKFSGLVSASKPDENPKPTPKPDEKPKPSAPQQEKTKPTVQSGWVGSSYYQDGKKVISKWIFDKKYNSYFYLDASGNYVQNAWVGNYYLKSGGYMAKGEWVYDTNYGSYYYLTSEGSYARNTWSGNYYLKSNGKMAKGEWVYDATYQAWYYLTSDGSYAYSTWQGNYYLKSDGKMAVNEWVDGGRYYVGADGVWKEGQASTASSSNDSNSEYSAALGKAKSYNSLFHMSKKRMYRQLTSDFDKFSNDAAQYAIDHLDD